MARLKDPTEPIRTEAGRLSGVAEGSACNQSSFKIGKNSFLFMGPGAKGVGFKAMFKLDQSMPQARALAAKEPTRFQAGAKPGWVTTRFTAQAPLPKSIWGKWLKESYALASAPSKGKKTAAKKTAAKKTAAKKKTARR